MPSFPERTKRFRGPQRLWHAWCFVRGLFDPELKAPRDPILYEHIWMDLSVVQDHPNPYRRRYRLRANGRWHVIDGAQLEALSWFWNLEAERREVVPGALVSPDMPEPTGNSEQLPFAGDRQ